MTLTFVNTRKCIPLGCIPCLERFNSNLVYYVESVNNYIESGKLRKLFNFNIFKKNSSTSTQTDFNYINVDCDGCEKISPINDWDIV